MALGGGTFVTQNKVIPGAYINFVNASNVSPSMTDRGVVAIAIDLDWAEENEIIEVTNYDIQKNSLKLFGYEYTDDKLKGLRDLFLNTKLAYVFRLNTGGIKASNLYATAIYPGIIGNNIRIVIEANESHTEENPKYDVITYFNNFKSDFQTVSTMSELIRNDYVEFKSLAEISLTAGMNLTGGENGTINNGSYQLFLDKIESYSFNVLSCLSSDDIVKALFCSFTKRMRDEVGLKFQCVLHKYNSFDYEGVVSVENNESSELVYFVSGIIGSCEVNKSNTNKEYNGEFKVSTDYTQIQLQDEIKSGKFMFHKVGNSIRVLEDINTLVTYTNEKGKDFSNNQTVRVMDQIANDIALIFSNNYLGKVPNDKAGRISLWNDIVKHHKELEKIRAIENFDPVTVSVELGENKKSVVVRDCITPTNAMTHLYMNVIVS